MEEMLVNLSFSDSYCLGEISGTHLPFTQELHHLLADRFHVLPRDQLLPGWLLEHFFNIKEKHDSR